MRSTTKERFKANSAVGMPCSLRRERSLRSATSTWSTKGLLLLVCFLSTAEAAGLWGLGSKNAAQRGVSRQSAISDDDSMDEVFAKLQQEQVCSTSRVSPSRPLISNAARAASLLGWRPFASW